MKNSTHNLKVKTPDNMDELWKVSRESHVKEYTIFSCAYLECKKISLNKSLFFKNALAFIVSAIIGYVI